MVQAWIALAGTSIDETGKKLEQDRQPAVGNTTCHSQQCHLDAVFSLILSA